MANTTASEERLRWRPWPCAACGRGVTPIGHLIDCLGASSALQPSEFDQSVRRQVALLQDWVAACPHSDEATVDLPKFAEGSEHAVYLETPTSVLKLSLVGTYGESYYLAENGMVFQQSCRPLEYLIRMRLWERLFGNAPVPIGITPKGQIVSRQPFIAGEPPSQAEVDAYLILSGLEPVKQSRWLWKKRYPEEYDVWVGDARNDNFVLTHAGMIPIDLRLWFCPGRPPQ